MKFKHPVSTVEGVRITGVYKLTLWKWGAKGKVRMYRENGENGPRIFDGDELRALAPHIKKHSFNGFSIFPAAWKWPKSKKKAK